MAWFTFRRAWMLAGFVAAGMGDWFLAVKGAPSRSPEFLCGVACFSLAQVLWAFGQLREARPDWRMALALALPLGIFAGVRLAPVLPIATGVAVGAYAVLTAIAFSLAYATRRVFYACGIGILCASDLMIGGGLLRMPGCHILAGPMYVLAEACLLLSWILPREWRFAPERRNVWTMAALGGSAAFLLFLLAGVCYPGGGYNPFLKMLSALGRTVVRGVAYPWCHYLFIAGLGCAALSVAHVWAYLVRRREDGWRGQALAYGTAANVAGLCTIALVPENVNMLFHNAGCHMAALGGAGVLFSRVRKDRRRDIVWTCVLLSVISFFGAFLLLHGANVLPFAPWVTATQKILIASFAVWVGDIAWRERSAPLRRWQKAVLVAVLAAGLAAVAAGTTGVPPFAPEAKEASADRPVSSFGRPLAEDELAALRWLDHVTGKLPPAEEKSWWDIGGTQHGNFSKRYHIAFCGYAAAALGMRGDAAQRKTVARIIGNCIERYMKRDVWAYSMSKNYWGRKPWAPDPCYRENVMYTGHLLQLLALYETFTGDKRYWRDGFDFVWKDGKRVHYDVKKLIDVTVFQMRNGPNGGITCEPGLMFFPCNNHPHVALSLFSRLGYGDWTKDARRWEKWALSKYVGPMFGGGAMKLVYHVRSGIFYPRGDGALDGWSLLWYEPWAADRQTAVALWRKAADKIDWEGLETRPDVGNEDFTCCRPVDVPPVAAASFLAAASRACDDDETADRLDAIADKFLVREGGMLRLEAGRDWRIGATANRIISLAEKNGSRLRDLVQGRGPFKF